MCRGFTTWPLLSLSSPSVFPRDQMTWNHLSTMCDPIHFIQKDLLTLKKTRDFIARRETNVLRFLFQYIFFTGLQCSNCANRLRAYYYLC